MASIRKAKKMGIYKPKKINNKLYNETRIMIEQVNKRLRNLEKGGNYNSYASKKLFNRLDAKSMNVLQKTRKGKHVLSVKLNKQLTNTELHAIQKASKQFLESATSTSRGIEKITQRTKESMLKTLKIDPDMEINKDDIETYYEMLGNNDFDFFNEKIGASSMWGLMEDAKEMDADENQWLKIIENHGMSIDEDVRNKALRLYDRYIL